EGEWSEPSGLKRGLLLDLELGVDDILLASTALAVAAGRSPSAGGTSTGALTAQVLFQGVHRRLQAVQRLANSVDVVAFLDLLHLLDSSQDRRLVAFRHLVAVLTQRLLDLVGCLLGLDLQVGQLLLALVLFR